MKWHQCQCRQCKAKANTGTEIPDEHTERESSKKRVADSPRNSKSNPQGHRLWQCTFGARMCVPNAEWKMARPKLTPIALRDKKICMSEAPRTAGRVGNAMEDRSMTPSQRPGNPWQPTTRSWQAITPTWHRNETAKSDHHSSSRMQWDSSTQRCQTRALRRSKFGAQGTQKQQHSWWPGAAKKHTRVSKAQNYVHTDRDWK